MKNSVDAVLLTQEKEPKLLLVKRKYQPFSGYWAFPGGRLNADEAPEVAAPRELEEETGISGVALVYFGYYDAPERDPRGGASTIFIGRPETVLDANGADDADEARWFPLRALPPLAFDHGLIISDICTSDSTLPAPEYAPI